MATAMISFIPNPDCNYRYDYVDIVETVNEQIGTDPKSAYELVRAYAKRDLFFFSYFILRLSILNHPWLLQRVYEVQDCNSDTMDLWAREHGKSSIITYALNLWTVVNNPEERIGIFSHTRGIAKAFLRRIKHTCEQNQNLANFFPEVFWNDPKGEAPKWSEDDGLILKRKGVYQEATFEAWGLVDSMPTGKHFTVLNYDDVVTVESVSTPDQLEKTITCFGISLNLGERMGKKRLIGTNYHFRDLYQQQAETGVWLVRRYPATADGTVNGEPVMLDPEQLKQKRLLMGSYVFSAQMLLNPVAGENQVFRAEWLRFYDALPQQLRLFAFVDPANAQKTKAAGSDYTAIAVIGLDADDNFFLVDMIRERLNLSQRWVAIRDIYLKWQRAGMRITRFYYEQYGMVSDLSYFEMQMAEEGCYFDVKPIGGRLAKEDRIKRLQPAFEAGNFFLPRQIISGQRDLIKELINQEYLTFPYSSHDDMLDAISRVFDEKVTIFRPVSTNMDEQSNLISLDGRRRQKSAWARRKSGSIYANC